MTLIKTADLIESVADALQFISYYHPMDYIRALGKAYDAYSFAVIPEIGARVAGDRASYQYLVESIRRFPDQATFARMITEAGFSQTGWTNFTAGVAALHTARAI